MGFGTNRQSKKHAWPEEQQEVRDAKTREKKKRDRMLGQADIRC